MAQMVELAALLLLMMTAHYAVAGSRHLFADALWAFFVWCAIFAAAFLLITVPPVLAWVVRGGLALGLIYAAWRLAIRLFRLLLPSRQLPEEARPEEIATLFQWRTPCDPQQAHGHVRELLRKYDPAVVALSVARLKQDTPADRALAGAARDCEAQTEDLTRLADRYRKLSAGDRDGALPFLARLLLDYRAGDVQRAVKSLERVRAPVRSARSRVLAELRRTQRLHTFVTALQEAQSENTPAFSDLDARLGAAGLAQAMLFPPLAFFRLGQAKRGVWFLAAYLLLVAYAIVALRHENSAGWVYLAVAGLYHLYGVFALRDIYIQSVRAERRPLQQS